MATKSWDSGYQDLLSLTDIITLDPRKAQASLCMFFKIVHGLCFFPGLVYACLVDQRASDCQVNPVVSGIDKAACLPHQPLTMISLYRTVRNQVLLLQKQIHVNLRNNISSFRLEPCNGSTFLNSTSNAPSLHAQHLLLTVSL